MVCLYFAFALAVVDGLFFIYFAPKVFLILKFISCWLPLMVCSYFAFPVVFLFQFRAD